MASSSTARVLSESTRPNTTSSASASAAAAMEVDQDAKALGSLTFPYNSWLTELREEISASLSKHPTVDKLAQNVKNSYQILVSPRAMISDLIRAIEQLNSKASNALTKDLMKIISQPKYDRSKFVNGWEQLTGNIEVMLRTRKRQRENEEKLEKDLTIDDATDMILNIFDNTLCPETNKRRIKNYINRIKKWIKLSHPHLQKISLQFFNMQM